MNDLLLGGRVILLDLASTLLFLGLYALTDNLVLAVALGVALAVVQICWRFWRAETVDALQWISVVTVLASGTTALVTHDMRFVMLKPTVIYTLVGLSMLRRGWMNRYMPVRAMEVVPDLVVAAGYAWAGLMFFSAILNIMLVSTCGLILWGTLMSVWGIASKTLLFFGQFWFMKTIGKRRVMREAPLAC